MTKLVLFGLSWYFSTRSIMGRDVKKIHTRGYLQIKPVTG